VGFERNREFFHYYYIFDPIDQMSQLGWSAFKRGQYGVTTRYYEQVFAQREENPNYYYCCAAEAWGALGQAEMALRYLTMAVDRGWSAHDYAMRSEHLHLLHGTPEWQMLRTRMQENTL
jgi:hypothetical protein